MKKMTILWVLLFLLGMNFSVQAQSYVPLQVTGFTDDLIANGSADVVGSTTHGFDWDGSGGSNYYQSGYVLGDSIGRWGLPYSGLINSISTQGVTYQLADYSGNNALLLVNLNDQGTLTFTNPGVFSYISICAASAGTSHVPTTFSAQLNFSDHSNSFYSFSVPDWFETNPYPTAIMGVGRAYRVTNTFQYITDNPKLFDCSIVLDSADQTKVLTSITCTKTVSNDRTGIFAVCGVTAVGTPPAVVATTATTTVNDTSFTANWNAAPGATTYYIDVSASSNFSTLVSSYNNLEVGNVTSFYVTGLTSNTTYYYRVRAANANGQGPNSNIITVTTPPLAAPTAAHSDINKFPANMGGNISLTIDGGNGDTLIWYSDSCGGTLVGTGTPLSIPKPTVTTTYYARWEINGNYSTCVSVTDTVIPATPIITQNKDTLISNAPSGNQWYSKQSGKIENATDSTYIPSVSGDYYVIVTENGYSSDTSNVIHVEPVGINKLSTNDNISIYPNPTSNKFNVEFNNQNETYNLEILNTMGQIILNKKIINNIEQVDLSGQSAGIYFVKLQTENSTIVKKIIKQ